MWKNVNLKLPATISLNIEVSLVESPQHKTLASSMRRHKKMAHGYRSVQIWRLAVLADKTDQKRNCPGFLVFPPAYPEIFKQLTNLLVTNSRRSYDFTERGMRTGAHHAATSTPTVQQGESAKAQSQSDGAHCQTCRLGRHIVEGESRQQQKAKDKR